MKSRERERVRVALVGLFQTAYLNVYTIFSLSKIFILLFLALVLLLLVLLSYCCMVVDCICQIWKGN